MRESKTQQLKVVAETLLLPLLLAWGIGEWFCSRPSLQRFLVEHHHNRPRVDRERIKFDYDLAQALRSKKSLIYIAGTSQVRDLIDPQAVAKELQGQKYSIVNSGGSAKVPTDIHAMRKYWLDAKPALLVTFVHPFHLNDRYWGFNDQRYDLVSYRKFHPESMSWENRHRHYRAAFNNLSSWLMYQRAINSIIDRQGRSLLRSSKLRKYSFDAYRPFTAEEKHMQWAKQKRAEALANKKHALYEHGQEELYQFPTRASNALWKVFELCQENSIPVLLLEAPDHNDTQGFYEPKVLELFKKELSRLKAHPAVVSFIAKEEFPEIQDHYVPQRKETNFLHARNARPLVAPYMAKWIEAALLQAKQRERK